MPYMIRNAAMATTAAQAAVSTGTAIKTMLQVATPATVMARVLAWGFSTSEDEAGIVELLQTDVAATVTAHVASGVQPLDPGVPAALFTLGTSATGYTASAEGAITATRTFDVVAMNASSNGLTYSYQFMPDEQPVIPISKFLRVRATFSTAINLRCWVLMEQVG
ncbi:hypothetical protein ACFO9E_18135 [Streptomyces maoxianensis]|uniref:Phage tail protein n=1 Tax=Streptomyces maoxianensis TaxID=1459942 RepID=A0ABV9G846_9ACTN